MRNIKTLFGLLVLVSINSCRIAHCGVEAYSDSTKNIYEFRGDDLNRVSLRTPSYRNSFTVSVDKAYRQVIFNDSVQYSYRIVGYNLFFDLLPDDVGRLDTTVKYLPKNLVFSNGCGIFR